MIWQTLTCLWCPVTLATPYGRARGISGWRMPSILEFPYLRVISYSCLDRTIGSNQSASRSAWEHTREKGAFLMRPSMWVYAIQTLGSVKQSPAMLRWCLRHCGVGPEDSLYRRRQVLPT